MTKFVLITLMFLVGGSTSSAPVSTGPETADQILSEVELQLALRDMWTSHIFWVRSMVFASHYDDGMNVESSESKAVANARSIADAIEPFYGQEASDHLFDLLAGHYGAIKEYMEATFDEDSSAAKAATDKLIGNAKLIATFLDGANPHLPEEAVLPMLLAHGGHHIQQINKVHEKDFAAEAEIRDQMVQHIYAIADAMAGAIAKQFPDKVTG